VQEDSLSVPMGNWRRRLVLLLLSLCPLFPIAAQGTGGDASSPGETPPTPGIAAAVVTVLAPLFIPKFIADAAYLKSTIPGEEFQRVRREAGDPAAVDTLFALAKDLSWGNLYAALLITTVAVMDHRRVGVDLPLLGELLWFPLTSEFEEEFRARVAALPSALYADSPRGGDRDKLQHFFGSAFIALLSESANAADRTGEFVEWGEEEFIVGGTADDRDARANREGQRFALRLLTDPFARPSQYLGRTRPVEVE
jgi:hypothetical protein